MQNVTRPFVSGAKIRSAVAGVAILSSAGLSPAASLLWDPLHTPATGSDGDGTWSTVDANFSNGTADIAWPNVSDTATFGAGGSGTNTVTLSVPIVATGITFNAGPAYTLTGSTLSLGTAGLTIAAAAAGPTISAPIAFTTGQLWTTNSTTATTISGVVSGSFGLTTAGAGNIVLTAASTYTGATILNGGTMTLAATPAGTSSFTINNGATLAIATGSALGQTAGKAAVTINSGGTLTSVTNPATGTNNAYAFFSNALTMNGGTLSAGASVYGNVYGFNPSASVVATSDANGTAALISASTGLSGTALPVNVTRGASTALTATSPDLNVTGQIINNSTAAGSIVKSGNGILRLANANNTFSGGVTVNAGTVIGGISAGFGTGQKGGFGAGPITVNTGGIIQAGTDRAVGGDYVSNSRVVNLTGGTWDMVATNDYARTVNLTAGTLTGTTGYLRAPQDYTFIANSATMTLSGLGINSLAAATASTITRLDATFGNITFDVATGTTTDGRDLLVTGPITQNSGVTGVDKTVTKNNTGNLVFSGINTYAGGTIVNAGTLTLSNGGPTGTIRGPLTINSGGTVKTTIADALGYSASTTNTTSGLVTNFTVTTLTLNGNSLFDISTSGNEGYLTNVLLNGGSVTGTGGGTFNFNTGVGITTGGTTPSIFSAGAVIRGAGLTVTTGGTTVAGADLTMGNISVGTGGTGTLTKNGADLLTVNGVRSYTAGTTLNAGKLILGGSKTTVEGPITVASGATLDIAVPSTNTGGGLITLNGDGVANTRLLLGSGKTIGFSGAGISILTAPTTIDADGATAATIQGFDINPNTIATADVASGSILTSKVNYLTGTYGLSFSTTAGSATATGDLTVNGVISGTGNATLATLGTAANNNGFSAGFYKRGNGSLTLGGASTYGSGTAVLNGSLILTGGDNRLPAATTVNLGDLSNNSGKLVLNGISQTVGGLSTRGTGTGNAIVGNSTTASTVVINYAPTDTTVLDSFGGTIGGTATNANNIGVTKAGVGTLVLTGANTYTAPTTVTGGTLELGTAAQAPVFTGGGANIATGQILFDYAAGNSSATTIRGLLATGYANKFTAGALRSSTATANRGLGYVDNSTAATPTNTVTVMATLYGDADLDGGVSINDFNLLAANFGQTGKVWSQGDFDYDGGVSINDFNLLAANFGKVLTSSSDGPNAAALSMWSFAVAHNDEAGFIAATGVPEPTSLALLAGGAVLGLRRRRASRSAVVC